MGCIPSKSNKVVPDESFGSIIPIAPVTHPVVYPAQCVPPLEIGFGEWDARPGVPQLGKKKKGSKKRCMPPFTDPLNDADHFNAIQRLLTMSIHNDVLRS
jgi:hypothetical protein